MALIASQIQRIEEVTAAREARTRQQKAEVSQLVKGYFIIRELDSGKREWTCRYCRDFVGKQFAPSALQRPLQHLMGISETGGSPQAKPCVSVSAPLSVRNRVRELYGLSRMPESLQVASPKQGGAAKQLTLHTVMEPSLLENLHRDMARAFYAANVDFSVAENPEVQLFLRNLSKANITGGFKPLSRKQLGKNGPWMDDVMKEVVANEDHIVKGRMVHCVTDGGKINNTHSRNIMGLVEDGSTIFVDEWATVTETGLGKTAFDISEQVTPRIIQLRERGCIPTGLTADNLAAEQNAAAKVKETYERQTGSLFILLACAMHAGNLGQQDLFGKVGNDQSECAKGFEMYRQALEEVLDISVFTKSHGKLRLKLLRVQCELDRFKPKQGKKAKQTLIHQQTRFRSVVRCVSRFHHLADVLTYLYSHQSGKMAESCADPPQRGKCKTIKGFFGRVPTLPSRALEAKTFLAPLHKFIRFADGAGVGSVCQAYEQWCLVESAFSDALDKAVLPAGDQKSQMRQSIDDMLQRRRDMWLQHYHLAGHVLRPEILASLTPETVRPQHIDALEKYLAEYWACPLHMAATSQPQDHVQIAVALWRQLLEKSRDFYVASVTGETSKLWTEARRCRTGADGLDWWKYRFADGSPERNTLFEPTRFLYACVVAEAASEREFSIAGVVAGGRPQLAAGTHSSLAHIYWHFHCQHRKARGDDGSSDVSGSAHQSDVETAKVPDDAEITLVEECLGELASGQSNESRHQALAEVAIPRVRGLIAQMATEAGIPLSGKVVASAVIDGLMEEVVTQNTLQRMGRAVSALRKYKQHEDSSVRTQARLLMNAWAHIYKETDCTQGTARDVVRAGV